MEIILDLEKLLFNIKSIHRQLTVKFHQVFFAIILIISILHR